MEANKSPPIREAIAVFMEAKDLQAAVEDLLASGFDQGDLGLMAGETTVRQALGDLYEAVDASEHEDGPRMAFVKKKSIGDTVHAWTGLFFAGTTTAAGAAVASAAVFGGALLTAATGAVAVGAVGALVGLIIHRSDAEYLEQQIDKGRMLLFVRTRDVHHEKRALEILRKHSAYDVKIYSVPHTEPVRDPQDREAQAVRRNA